MATGFEESPRESDDRFVQCSSVSPIFSAVARFNRATQSKCKPRAPIASRQFENGYVSLAPLPTIALRI